MHESDERKSGFMGLCVGAVGVVYGDIGTSPLYAMKEIFNKVHGVAPTPENVLGAMSLIFWSLVLVICLKYVIFIMRADNRGEGGIMALMALALRSRHRPQQRAIITTLGLFGAALFYGDGMITPAISVLSAVEGVEIAAPALHAYVVPATIAVLLVFFLFQRAGTEKIGKLFGPVMLIWFASLSVLGIRSLVQSPEIIDGLHPGHAVAFFADHGVYGFMVLGAVVLALTGAEALYADMGHFGRLPIQVTWLTFVMPALLLNYLGQGALILREPAAVQNPFYLLAPDWAAFPLIGLSTMATVIASQAVVSGAFSITRQAVQLGYIPRQRFVHTSSSEMGQVYAPGVNKFLLVTVIGLVLIFQSSSNLASAYGLAVTGTMAIDTSLAFIVAMDVWKWPFSRAVLFLAVFLVVDFSFLGANAVKVADGGWFPLLIGMTLFVAMTTWKKGRQVLSWQLQRNAISLMEFLRRVEEDPPMRVSGTAIFLYGRHLSLPFALLQNVEYNKILHDRVFLLTVETDDIPYVMAKDRLHVEDLGQNFFRITIKFGFKQAPQVPYALSLASQAGINLNLAEAFYFIGRETLVPSDNPALNAWQERIFIFMFRNATSPISFFSIPTDRALEIGTLLEV